jgi:hypothetical protein
MSQTPVRIVWSQEMKKLKIAAVIVLGLCGLFGSLEMLTRTLDSEQAKIEAKIEAANLERLNKALGTSYTNMADATAEQRARHPPPPPPVSVPKDILSCTDFSKWLSAAHPEHGFFAPARLWTRRDGPGTANGNRV